MRRILLVASFLVLVVPASAARLPVLASHDWWPVFSPDSRQIAFTNVNGQGRLFTLEVVDAATRRVTRLARASSQLLPSWSPDSTKLAYQSGGRIWTVSVDGRGRHAVHAGLYPSWSPDGATIAYVLDGVVHAGPATAGANVIGVPTWSPDSKQVAFAQSDGVYVVALGGAVRKVASPLRDTRSASWSPDGSNLAYESGADVYVVPASGSAAPQKVAGPFSDLGPLAWAPAGDLLAYTVRGGVELTTLGPSPHSSRLVAGAAVGTSFAPGDPHGDVLAYSGPDPHCAGHDAIRLFDEGIVAGSCAITGTAAADTIEGTAEGGDAINAGGGNDTIRARNGHGDVVDCGPGRDVVTADRVDRLSRCEIVHR